MSISRAWLSAGLLVVLSSCTGTIGAGGERDPGGGDPADQPTGPGPTPDGPRPPAIMGRGGAGGGGVDPGPGPAVTAIGPGRLRRLTHAQLENTLRDLLGASVTSLPLPDADGVPSVAATYAALTDATVDEYDAALATMMATYFADTTLRQGVTGCVPTSGDAACFRTFVTGFGRRAWRRPLVATEIDRYVKLAIDAASALADPWRGLAYAATGLLESPNFLYRVEIGAPDPNAGGRYRFDSFEIASRLSYFLTGSTPDTELLQAADSRQLDAPDGLRVQAMRLLQSGAAKTGLSSYAREYMQLDDFVSQGSGEPRYTESLRVAMRDEVIHLFQSRLAPGTDTLDLLDTPQAFVTAELAQIYEIPGITSKTSVEAPLPANVPRAGLLGTGAFLAMTSLAKMEEKTTSPTGRGVYINETILCRDIPPPPANVKMFVPPVGATPTKREYMEMHRSDPGCAACHGLFDPIGFAFENFDWVGANRQLDQGKPVNTTGQLDLDDFTFKNSKELVTHLKGLPDTQRCFVQNLFRYANGHEKSDFDEALIDAWSMEFSRQGRDWTRSMAAMVASDGFRYVSPPPAVQVAN
jgi:hypothetical protein